MTTSTWVKICGITCVEDARLAHAAGADAIGLNLVPTSKRALSRERAREIADALRGSLELVGVIADLAPAEAEALREEIGLDALQLHGAESPRVLDALLPRAFKVVHVASERDVNSAADYAGERLLVDTKLGDQRGGTGQTFDWGLVRDLCRERRVILAGGLTPDNVGLAVERVAPWGVDVASGTEPPGEPRRKDPERVRRFVRAAKGRT